MPQRYLYTIHEESGIPSTRTTCKKAKLDEVLAAHCRADLVTEYTNRKKHKYYQVTFIFVFRPKMNVHFRFRPQMEFHFRRHFRLRPKMKNAFRSASSIHHKRVLVMVLRCKEVLVLVWNSRLGLGLGLERILKSWSWS